MITQNGGEVNRQQQIQQALDAGLTLIPIPSGGKRPTAKNWQSDPALWITTTEQAAQYVLTHPADGVGVLHSASRTAALDIDDAERAAVALAAVGIDLAALVGGDGPRIKGKNGEKPLYRLPQGIDLKTVKLTLDGTVFELRGGYGVQDVLPPSIHPDTQRPYEWTGTPLYGPDSIPLLPDCLLDLWQHWPERLKAMKGALGVESNQARVVDATPLYTERTATDRYVASAVDRELERMRATAEGGRNDQLNRSAFALGQLVGAGVLAEAEARAGLLDAARSVGLTEAEALATIRSGLASGRTKPRNLSHVGQRPNVGMTVGGFVAGESAEELADNLPEKPNLLQYRNLVMQEQYERGEVYRYHQTWRSWWQYQNGVYSEVLDEVMYQRTDLILQKHGQACRTGVIKEILEKISREPSVARVKADQGNWELNTVNGILDLSSGELFPHTTDYFSTTQSAAAYNPNLVAHDWLAFLHEAVPSADDRKVLQMFAGLCLTGDTSPQRALLLIGDGGTGKSTFVRVLSAVLGNLATSSALENIKDGSFLVGNLVGKRLCVVSELQRNVDWLPFKRVTGEDMISVDVKNKTPYTVKLDIKLIILTNVLPFLGADSSNTSLMRRFLPIEFNVKPAVPDPFLESRLTHPDELSGVLNWAIEGLHLLIENGMKFPSGGTGAKVARELVEASNKVILFLQECTGYVQGAETGAQELYNAYTRWCDDTGHSAGSNTTFAAQLLAAGAVFGRELTKVKRRDGAKYQHVSLHTNVGNWEADHEV